MLNQGRLALTVILVCGAVMAEVAQAQLFGRREPARLTVEDLQLKENSGDWLIMCAAFDAETGMQSAYQLAAELRTEHRLDAYVYRHHFDHKEKLIGSAWAQPKEKIGLPKPAQWKTLSADSYDKVAVLVGAFSSPHEHKATETLNKIKGLNPRSMQSNRENNEELSLEAQYRAHGRGPLSAAFLLTNPLLPDSYFENQNFLSEEVRKINKPVKYSLLKCPKPYTVRVATFGGEKKFNVSSFDIRKAQQQDNDRNAVKDSKLYQGVYKANILCRALRKKGVEAYEFHDLHESYVCVGSFDWATRKLENGKDILNPEIADIILKYKAMPVKANGRTQLVPRTIAEFKNHDLSFDSQPLPIPVPKVAKVSVLPSRKKLRRR